MAGHAHKWEKARTEWLNADELNEQTSTRQKYVNLKSQHKTIEEKDGKKVN